MKGKNVVDVGYEQKDIIDGLIKALSPEFAEDCSRNNNPYGSGKASEKIIEVLNNIDINDRFVVKHFNDIDG